MDAGILSFIIAAIALIRELVQAGSKAVDVLAAIDNIHAKIRQLREENRDPSAEEWAALNAMIAANRARLNVDPTAAGG